MCSDTSRPLFSKERSNKRAKEATEVYRKKIVIFMKSFFIRRKDDTVLLSDNQSGFCFSLDLIILIEPSHDKGFCCKTQCLINPLVISLTLSCSLCVKGANIKLQSLRNVSHPGQQVVSDLTDHRRLAPLPGGRHLFCYGNCGAQRSDISVQIPTCGHESYNWQLNV